MARIYNWLVNILGKAPRDEANLIIGTIRRSSLTGIGLAGSRTTVPTRDGGDTMADFVGIAVGERHVGKGGEVVGVADQGRLQEGVLLIA
jgi:hypothetical protein